MKLLHEYPQFDLENHWLGTIWEAEGHHIELWVYQDRQTNKIKVDGFMCKNGNKQFWFYKGRNRLESMNTIEPRLLCEQEVQDWDEGWKLIRETPELMVMEALL